MTIQWGDTGKVVVGSSRTLSVTPYQQEYLYGTTAGAPFSSAQTLPTTQPTSGVGSVTFTISSSNLSSIAPSYYSSSYSAIVVVGGLNSSASSVTVNYQCTKNGANISGGSGSQTVAANTYWTQSHYRYGFANANDAVGVNVWASATGCTIDYQAIMIYPTSSFPSKSSIIKDVSFSMGSNTLTAGNPSVASTKNYYMFPENSNNVNYNPNTGTTNTTGVLWVNSSCGVGRIYTGDQSSGSDTNTHASYRPYYSRQYYITSISFREVLR